MLRRCCTVIALAAMLLVWSNGNGWTIEYAPGVCWERGGALVCESEIA